MASQPFIGEIRMFGGTFAPVNWALCNGQLMAIADNDALFALIGTTYGGDGQTTFALPNLQSRIPIHNGQGSGGLSNYVIGQAAGVEDVTLSAQTMPQHNHSVVATTNAATTNLPSGALLANPGTAMGTVLYDTLAPQTPALTANTIANTGGGAPHDNLMPILCVTFIIALFGIFPSQN
jgi:microcystin-dependent protein